LVIGVLLAPIAARGAPLALDPLAFRPDKEFQIAGPAPPL